MSNVAAYTHSITISRLTLKVHLGVGKAEQSKKQKVVIHLRLDFPSTMKAPKDNQGYLCYGDISETIRAFCEGKKFRLIEALGMQIFALVRKQVPSDVAISLAAHKCSIPVSFVKDGVIFRYSDLPPGAWFAPDII